MTRELPGSAQPTPPPSAPGERVDKLAALHERLAREVAALRTGEDWHRWLTAASRFHEYSLNNILLILSQRPDATAVAGYDTWKTLGRQVTKGQKGIAILAPVIRRSVASPDGETPRAAHGDGDVAHGAAAQRDNPREAADLRSRVTGFRVAYVWDISQTTGQPLPERPSPRLLTGEAPPGLWQDLAEQVERRGFRLDRGPCGGANGLTDFASAVVRVRDDVDDAQAVKTLAHELGHVLLHQPVEEARALSCRGIIEVEAESVAYVVATVHGLDVGGYSFPYVTSWASGIAGQAAEDVVRATAERVLVAARTVLSRNPQALLTDAATVGTRLPEREHEFEHAPRKVRGVSNGGSATQQAAESKAHKTVTKLRAPLVAGKEEHTTGPRDSTVSRGDLAAVHDHAAAFYRAQVANSWVPAYLGSRALSAALGPPWDLGHAPARWTALVDHLRKLGYDDDLLVASGVALVARTGHVVDRFRDRIMIPIRDADGQTIAFVGRNNPTCQDDRSPRYLNSPQTALYRKPEVLLGLCEGRADLERGARPVIVEGPLDAIAVTAGTAGRCVGLAACGTAISPAHIDQLARAVDLAHAPLVVATDRDAAGIAAMTRLLPLLGARGLIGTAADLPGGSDPADVLMRHGPAALTADLLDRAKPLEDVVIEQTLARWTDRLRWVEGRVGAVRAVAPILATLPPADIRQHCERIACLVDVELETVFREVASCVGAPPGRTPGPQDRSADAVSRSVESCRSVGAPRAVRRSSLR